MQPGLYFTSVVATLLAGAAPGPAMSARTMSNSCQIIDSFRDFIDLSTVVANASADQQLAAFHKDFLAKNLALYVDDAVGLTPGPKLDRLALRSMATARSNPLWREMDATVRLSLPGVAARFAAALPDFRCDFPIYVAPSFGQMDGAGRLVGGRPALILGVDTISSVESPGQLPVFLTHEMFHRYHFQVAGFSDDPGEHQLIWRTLWAEGLATYVSAQLNPSNPLSDALIAPRDLEVQARPLTAMLAQELRAGLDREDGPLYGTFFEYGDPLAKQRSLPWRSGYYIGYRVACELAKRHPLAELAHLEGPSLRKEIGDALATLRP